MSLQDKMNVNAKPALNSLKTEIANELGLSNYEQQDKGNLTARQNGYVGGYMTKRLVEMAERQLAGKKSEDYTRAHAHGSEKLCAHDINSDRKTERRFQIPEAAALFSSIYQVITGAEYFLQTFSVPFHGAPGFQDPADMGLLPEYPVPLP